jgi:hypothetical protein
LLAPEIHGTNQASTVTFLSLLPEYTNCSNRAGSNVCCLGLASAPARACCISSSAASVRAKRSLRSSTSRSLRWLGVRALGMCHLRFPHTSWTLFRVPFAVGVELDTYGAEVYSNHFCQLATEGDAVILVILQSHWLSRSYERFTLKTPNWLSVCEAEMPTVKHMLTCHVDPQLR